MATHQNSFHEEVKKEKQRRNLRILLFSFLSFIVCIAILWVLFFSPLCRFHAVSVLGPKTIHTKDFQKAFAPLIGQNIFFYSIDTAKIEQTYPVIESVSIQPAFFGVANVSLQIATAKIAIQTTSKTYIIGSNTSVVDSVSNASTKYHLPLIVSNQADMKKVDLTSMIQFVTQLEVDKTEFVVSFTYTYPYDLQVLYADGHTVLLSLNKSIATQINAIKGVEKYVGFSKCKHLDVRFDNVYCSN